MDRWKAEQGRGREKRKIRRKEDGDARKGRKVTKHCVFPMICGSGGSKSRLAKVAGAEPAGQISDEKLHAVVARSRFPSQNVQNTPVSDHFWKLRCQKSARRCGAKHICKSKCRKHLSSGPLLEVAMSKKCTPLWREAHFQVKSQNAQNTPLSDHFWKLRCRKSARRCGAKHISKSKVKMHKTHHCRTTFGSSDVEKLHAVVARSRFPSQNVQKHTSVGPLLESWDVKKAHVVVARRTFRSQNVKNTRGSDHFWRFGCRFASIHYYTTLQYTTLHYITLQYAPLH